MEDVKATPELDSTSGEGSGDHENRKKTTEVDGDGSSRKTPPGRKRLFLTFSVVFSFLLGRVS